MSSGLHAGAAGLRPASKGLGRAPKSEERAALESKLTLLWQRANSGDRAAPAELRQFMDDHPEIHEVLGDLARYAEADLLNLLAGKNALQRESIQRRLLELKASLAGQHPTYLEKMLVDQIGICHMAYQHAEMAAASSIRCSISIGAFRQRRAESTQRRLIRAMKTLATLRALAPEGLAPLNGFRIYAEGA